MQNGAAVEVVMLWCSQLCGCAVWWREETVGCDGCDADDRERRWNHDGGTTTLKCITGHHLQQQKTLYPSHTFNCWMLTICLPVESRLVILVDFIPSSLINYDNFDDERSMVESYNVADASDKTSSFAKTLTQSDANNGGGFSVPRYCAETIFPKLDYSADPPVQTVVAKDVQVVDPFFWPNPRRLLQVWAKASGEVTAAKEKAKQAKDLAVARSWHLSAPYNRFRTSFFTVFFVFIR
ncbi:hypothetical protein M8C21_028839 [Ambrosia artemisiifolia]|uniref:Uncharacterized protein n=1 Tax=Ambrosia artemisiifolia TaxID=4212 RepID=A0AAD5D1Q8_AMBAR|nr:hypothetical protein M8C21_028839 [Ambrosia artemisiifolia]